MVVVSQKNTQVRLRHAKNAGTSKSDSGPERRISKSEISPDRPLHKHRVSLFTSYGSCAEPQGVLTGFIMLLVITNICLIFESIIKNGNLIDPYVWVKMFLHKPTESPTLLVYLSCAIVPSLSLGIETLLYKGLLNNKVGSILIVLLVTGLIYGSAMVVVHADCYYVTGVLALICASAAFLKLVSYHLVNYWCRLHWSLGLQKHRSSETSTDQELETTEAKSVTNHVSYPDNVNFKDIYYFFLAPTLSYELNFPRTSHVRKAFLSKRVLEMVLLSPVICGLTQQCVAPMMNSFLQGEESWMTCSSMLDVFKLLISFSIVWSLIVYWIFHSSTNAFAEILRFGDRYFYGDFWNSGSMRNYWKRWNVPVHNWCAKHLFVPLIRGGRSELMAAIIVFTVSGFFHEYFISVPMKMFQVRNILGLTIQGPFAILMERIIPGKYFNILIWILMCGQGLFIVLQYKRYLYSSQINQEHYWSF